MTSSFPFFRIAQQLNRPYRDVLEMADFVEKSGPYDPIWDAELYCHVENAVLTEQARRVSVVRQPQT
jgi:hypothetical protein